MAKKKLKEPTQRDVRKVLDQIVAILNTKTVASANLWHILTALRGPDSDYSFNLKDWTTGRVRAAIGLRFGAGSGAIVTNKKLDLKDIESRDEKECKHEGGHHFWGHYNQAVNAIQDIYKYDLKKEEKI
jgi:hypothetical protein